MNKKMYYCQDCDRVIDRRSVIHTLDRDGEDAYFCKDCCGRVMRSDKVNVAMFKDFCKYLIQQGKEAKYE